MVLHGAVEFFSAWVWSAKMRILARTFRGALPSGKLT